ncbi:uncharacterized protein VP01_803g2 [Puccinia sorghi]|uniref:CCHC-type domain-containing protein n=1 Tax=Puccinia sorghi TaxID=27349 RepID=A0A0L6UB92_9BASI|nr:uncharacterized protein VP01_803g2 [Puccinia sorghi]
MSNVEFDSLRNLTTSTPAPEPNAIDLSAFQKAPNYQLSDTKKTRWVQGSLCFHCGQAGHISCRCLNGGKKPQDHPQPPSLALISKLQVEINLLRANPSASNSQPQCQ